MNTIYDTILWLQSQATGKRFPKVQFSSDTDMPTQGWISLTSLENQEIVITQLTGEEYRATFEGYEGYESAEQRVNRLLGRSDLRCVWFLGIDKTNSNDSKPSSLFRYWQPPKLLYRDILEKDSVAKEVSRLTLSEFERDGGKLLIVK